MSIQVTIAGITRGVAPESLSVSHTLFQRSTCSVTLPDPQGDIELSVGQSISITEEAYTHFAGTITEYSRDVSGPSGLRTLQIAAVDHTQVCDRRYCSDWTFSGSTPANDIVRFIADSYLTDEGIDLSFVLASSGPLVSDFVIRYETVSEALNRLAQQINYYWTIDKDKKLVFRQFAVGSVVATLNEPSQHVIVGSLQSKETRDGFANHVTVRVAGFLSEFHDTLTGDGTKQTFVLSNWPTAVPMVQITEPGGDPQWVYVGDEEKETFPPQFPDSEGNYPPYSALWKAGSNWITVSRAVPTGAVIEVVYKTKGVAIYDAIDADSINERKAVEGGSGVYTKVIEIDAEKDNSGITAEQAQAIADAELAKSVQLATTISFTSHTIIAKPGEKLISNLPSVPSGTYGVRSVRTTLLGVDHTRSTIEAVSGNILLDGLETLGTAFGYQRDSFSLPVQRDVKPRIPNIENLTVDASQVEIDGVLKYKLDFSYTVPAASSDPAAAFGGVHVYLEDGGKRQDLHAQPLSAGKAAGDTETFTLIMRLPVADTDWKYFVPSRNWHSENVNTWNGLTPNVTVQAKAKPLSAIPDVTNFHAGTYDGSTWTADAYWDDLGSQLFIDWQATIPADVLNWSGVQMWLHEGSTYVPATGILGLSSSDTQQPGGVISGDPPISLSAQFAPSSGAYELIAVSFDRDGNRHNDISGKPTGPKVTVAVPGRVVPPGTSVPDPVAPSSAHTVAVIDKGNQFSLSLAWVPANPVGGNVGIEAEAMYFKDASATTADSGWIPLGSIRGATTSTTEFGAYSRNVYDSWVKTRIRSYNSASVTSAWVESTNAAKVDKTTEAGITLPGQPTSGGWSVAVTNYSKDPQTGKALAKLTVTVTEHPVDVDYFSVWTYRGSSAPSNAADFVAVANKAVEASGNTVIDVWVDRDLTAYTLQFAVTGSSYTYYGFPDGSTPSKAVVIPAVADAAQPTGFAVTVERATNAGVPSGRYVFSFTKPTDTEYHHTNIYGRWCDSSFTAVTEWQEVFSGVDPGKGDWWPIPSTAEYHLFQARSVTKGEKENSTSAPTVQVTVSPSGGLDLTQADATKKLDAQNVQGSFGNNVVVNASTVSGTFGNNIVVSASTVSGTFGSNVTIGAGSVSGTFGNNVTLNAGSVVGSCGNNVSIDASLVNGTFGNNVQVQASTVVGNFGNNVQLNGQNIVGLISGENIKVATSTFQGVVVTDQLDPSMWSDGLYVDGTYVKSTSDKSLIPNGSFENGLVGFVTQGDATSVTTPVHSGGKAARISQAGNGGIFYGPVPVSPGDQYLAEAMVGISSGGESTALVGLRFSNNTGSIHDTTGGTEDHFVSAHLTTTGWLKMSSNQVSVPTSYRYMWVLVGWNQGNPSTGYLYVDSVKLEKVIDSTRISSVTTDKLIGLIAGNNVQVDVNTLNGVINANNIPVLSGNQIGTINIGSLPMVTSDKVAAEADNLVDNPGWESGLNVGWTLATNLPANFILFTGGGISPRTGNKCVAHFSAGGSTGQRAVAYSNYFNARVGETFSHECYAIADTTDGFVVTNIEFYDSNTTYLGSFGSSPNTPAPTSGWTKVSGTATAPANTAKARYVIILFNHISGSNAWLIDDVRVVRQINGAQQVQQGSLSISHVADINTINISNLSGNLDISRVTNVGTINISNLSGSLDVSRLTNVQNLSINGSQVNNIVASTITIGQIQNSQIGSMSASKLTAGTIDASTISVVNLNASNLTSGNIAGRQITLDLNGITTTITNQFDGTVGGYLGIQTKSNTASTVARMSPGILYLQGANFTQIRHDATSGTSSWTDSSGNGTVNINLNGTGNISCTGSIVTRGLQIVSGYTLTHGANTVLDGSGNLTINGQLRVANYLSTSVPPPSTSTAKIAVYTSSGAFLGWSYVFSS